MAFALALILAWGQDAAAAPESPAQPPSPAHIIVTTVAPLDAQRLADALRAYLDDVGVRIEPHLAGAADGLRQQLEDARRLGHTAQATAVVRVERDLSAGEPGEVEIQLIDLTTDEVVIATIASPARDEDRYRALALKIQALFRTRWSARQARSEAQDPPSGELDGSQEARFAARAPWDVALDVGLALVSFPISGPVFDGVEVRGRWLPTPRIALAIGTAVLGSTSASSGGVEAVTTIVPIRGTAMLRLATGRAALFAGPAAELSFLRVNASSATTPVRSVRHVMLALGGEADARLALVGPLCLFARTAALGVLNGERYDAAGVPLIDTSRFELTGTVGLALGIP